MRVLGVDPGTIRMGWGVVEIEGTRLRGIDAGICRAREDAPLHERLRVLHAGLVAVLEQHRPTVVAVEEIFFAKHANAALKLGHARGVALLAAANAELEVFAYAPSVVKQTVVGRGRATKDQVSRIVQSLLGLREAPGEDATDALAIAITHARAAKMHAAIAAAKRPVLPRRR
jgi:crossover junction endodeoxyribonuclease RuvC